MPLACGAHRAFVRERGGPIIAELPWESLAYGRALNDSSDATVSVGPRGLADETCCWALNRVRAWSHELSIWRDDEEVWRGPTGDPAFGRDAVDLEARDLFAWFDRKTLPIPRNLNGVDLGTIFETWAQDALSLDDPGIILRVRTVGETGDRSVGIGEIVFSGDQLRGLGRTALDWTMIVDELFAGSPLLEQPTVPILHDDEWIGPSMRLVGAEMATQVIVVGSSGAAAGDPIIATAGGGDAERATDIEPDPEFGLIQQVFNESEIDDQASADFAAQEILDRLRGDARVLSGRIAPDSALEFDRLIPGLRFRPQVRLACQDLDREMILRSVQVSATSQQDGGEEEQVDVELSSPGVES